MSDKSGNGRDGGDDDDVPEVPEAPFARGSDTSEEAAESIGDDLMRLEGIVLLAIVTCGARGATCDEVEASLSMRHQTCSARVNGLAARGLIADSGERRRTRSNRNAAVYVAAEYMTPEMHAKAAELALDRAASQAKRAAEKMRGSKLSADNERLREQLVLLVDAATKMSRAWNSPAASPSDVDRADKNLRALLAAIGEV